VNDGDQNDPFRIDVIPCRFKRRPIDLQQFDPSYQQFKGQIADLQTRLDGRGLRKKVIRLAQSLNPRPTVPREAREHEGCLLRLMLIWRIRQGREVQMNKYIQSHRLHTTVIGMHRRDLLHTLEGTNIYFNAGRVADRSDARLIRRER